MKKYFLLFSLSFSLTTLADYEVIARVKMVPAVGSFDLTSHDIQGVAVKGEKLTASLIEIKAQTLKSENDLRDSHMLEKINAQNYPVIKLENVIGENGVATGQLSLNGVQKPIKINYTEKDNFINANFKISLNEFNVAKVSYRGIGVEDEIEISAKIPMVLGAK